MSTRTPGRIEKSVLTVVILILGIGMASAWWNFAAALGMGLGAQIVGSLVALVIMLVLLERIGVV